MTAPLIDPNIVALKNAQQDQAIAAAADFIAGHLSGKKAVYLKALADETSRTDRSGLRGDVYRFAAIGFFHVLELVRIRYEKAAEGASDD